MVDFRAFYFSDAITFILFCLFAVFLAARLGRINKFFFNFFLILSLVHLVTMMFGLLFTQGDARKYYIVASSLTSDTWLASFGQGTTFINFFTYILVNILKLSYSGGYFFYASVGLAGYYIIIRLIIFLIKKYNLLYKNQYFYVLLLPGIHLWNIAIGKDAIMFFTIALFFSGIIRSKTIYIIIGALIMGIIRSPVLLLFVVGIVMGNLIINKKVSLLQKWLIFMIAIVMVYAMLPLIQERLKLESVDYDSINDKVAERLLVNQGGGSSINMSNASAPEKMFAFLFRPLFYDAKSVNMFLSSFENLVWLFMVYKVLRNFRSKLFNSQYSALFAMMILAFFLPVFAQSSMLTNLGIAVRMKTMYFLPLFVLFILSSDYSNRRKLVISDALYKHI